MKTAFTLRKQEIYRLEVEIVILKYQCLYIFQIIITLLIY